MASDRQQYNRALGRWHELYESGSFSVEPEAGRLAIICSLFNGLPASPAAEIVTEETQNIFKSEALAIAAMYSEQGYDTEVVLDAGPQDLIAAIADPEVSDVMTIGNGSLTELYFGPHSSVDWRDVSNATSHLKQGSFIQRQCGWYSRDLSVPLGLFAVVDHTNVHAALGVFLDSELDVNDNSMFEPVAEVTPLEYDEITYRYRQNRSEK